jgi:hypothetical protein
MHNFAQHVAYLNNPARTDLTSGNNMRFNQPETRPMKFHALSQTRDSSPRSIPIWRALPAFLTACAVPAAICASHWFSLSPIWQPPIPQITTSNVPVYPINSHRLAIPRPKGSASALEDPGSLDEVNSTSANGWAWNADKPNDPVTVIVLDGDVVIGTILANEPRSDLQAAGKGNGLHAFRYPLAGSLPEGNIHLISARNLELGVPLHGGAQLLQQN